VDEMSFIDPGPVRVMRAQEEAEAEKLRAEIARLSELLSVREARIAVLDEVLSRCKVEVVRPPPPPPQLEPELEVVSVLELESRQRTTASGMAERREAVVAMFKKHGDMTPRDLLPLVNDELGEELVAHQLRAVLRKFKDLFESRPDQHGIWGLVRR
jgi:uncharacterized small protein (DUF1192 family)